jgi:hypothetical protein
MKKEIYQNIKTEKNKNMKRYLLIIAMLLGAFSSWGQTKADQAAVLQKCIDLPALESLYAKDATGNPEQLCILQPKFAFPANLEVTKFAKAFRLVTKAQVYEQGINNFIYLDKFDVGETTASVRLFYYRNYTSTLISIKVSVELTKTGSAWNVVNSNIEKN